MPLYNKQLQRFCLIANPSSMDKGPLFMKARLVFTLIMSFILSFFMTCWVTFINLGLSELFLSQWGRALLLAWPAAAVISFLFGPVAQRMTQKILGQTS